MKIKVFLADDHRVLADGLRLLISGEEDLQWAGTVDSGNALMAALDETPVDVLLLDINLPGKSGIELCALVKDKYPHVRTLGLSTYDKGSIIRKMMKSGASGFVVKNTGSEELLGAIRAVASGEIYMGKLASKALLDEMTGSQSERSDFIPALTRREKQVLKLIVEEHTTPEIAEKLFISVNTAETYRKNLLHKLNAKNSAGLVRIAMERGLVD